MSRWGERMLVAGAIFLWFRHPRQRVKRMCFRLFKRVPHGMWLHVVRKDEAVAKSRVIALVGTSIMIGEVGVHELCEV